MADRPSKALFPNPFYVVLLVSSTIFTVTVLAYLVSPNIPLRALNNPGADRPGAGSLALVEWLDRKGPLVLGVEFAVMFLSGVLAMATDRWFPSQTPRQSPPTR